MYSRQISDLLTFYAEISSNSYYWSLGKPDDASNKNQRFFTRSTGVQMQVRVFIFTGCDTFEMILNINQSQIILDAASFTPLPKK